MNRRKFLEKTSKLAGSSVLASTLPWYSVFSHPFSRKGAELMLRKKEPYAVTTFHSIGIYWKTDEGDTNNRCTVRYRLGGTSSWTKAQDLWFDDSTDDPVWFKSYRGSIVNMQPDSFYEIELKLASGRRAVLQAETWNDIFPVAKTYRISNSDRISTTREGGSSAGYVVYDGEGAVIDVGNREETCFQVNHSYVIVRNFILKGAAVDGLRVMPGVTDVVIEDCNISGWGGFRKPPVTGEGSGWGCTSDAGIDLGEGCKRVIIQGNRIHHPRYGTNTWGEDGHPKGPSAVWGNENFDENFGNHVIRYNQIYGNRHQMFNDAIHGKRNKSRYGFPGPDTDIYGNYIADVADNCIETEGGGRNVRVWRNYMTQCYSGIATAAVAIGPLYAFRNVCDVTDPMGRVDKSFKVGDEISRGVQYLYHNINLHPVRFGLSGVDGGALHIVSRNNIYLARDSSIHQAAHSSNDFDYDLCNTEVMVPSGSLTNGILNTNPVWRTNHGPSSGDGGWYQLKEGSPGIDAGVHLPNFNDDYHGAGPDIGAHEHGESRIFFGIKAWENYRAQYHYHSPIQ